MFVYVETGRVMRYRQVCVQRDRKSDEVQTGLCSARREEW